MDCLFSVFDICFGRRETAPCLRTYVRTYHTFPTSANWQQTHTVPGIISVVGPLIFAAWTTQQHNQWSNGQISRWLVRLARRVWKRYRIAVRCKWPVAERVHANRTLPAYVTPGIHDHEQTGQGYLTPAPCTPTVLVHLVCFRTYVWYEKVRRRLRLPPQTWRAVHMYDLIAHEVNEARPRKNR